MTRGRRPRRSFDCALRASLRMTTGGKDAGTKAEPRSARIGNPVYPHGLRLLRTENPAVPHADRVFRGGRSHLRSPRSPSVGPRDRKPPRPPRSRGGWRHFGSWATDCGLLGSRIPSNPAASWGTMVFSVLAIAEATPRDRKRRLVHRSRRVSVDEAAMLIPGQLTGTQPGPKRPTRPQLSSFCGGRGGVFDPRGCSSGFWGIEMCALSTVFAATWWTRRSFWSVGRRAGFLRIRNILSSTRFCGSSVDKAAFLVFCRSGAARGGCAL